MPRKMSSIRLIILLEEWDATILAYGIDGADQQDIFPFAFAWHEFLHVIQSFWNNSTTGLGISVNLSKQMSGFKIP